MISFLFSPASGYVAVWNRRKRHQTPLLEEHSSGVWIRLSVDCASDLLSACVLGYWHLNLQWTGGADVVSKHVCDDVSSFRVGSISVRLFSARSRRVSCIFH